MSWNKVLENYARSSNPLKDLPSNVILLANDQCITIFDGYEKAKFHFLVLPRDPFRLSTGSQIRSTYLHSLQTLRTSQRALEVLKALEAQAQRVKDMIEDEMMKQYGFKWQIHCGFHAVESMSHVHLHVISSDMLSDRLKNKKHYNSFHPELGFFLHLSDVIDQVTAGVKDTRSAASYEQLLKEPLRSIYTDEEFKSIPALKSHLEAEFNKRQLERKRAIAQHQERRVEQEQRRDEIGGDKDRVDCPPKIMREDRNSSSGPQTQVGAASIATPPVPPSKRTLEEATASATKKSKEQPDRDS